MHIGIVGLPNTGKTALFNALTHAHAAVGVYSFTTVEPNHGSAQVPDARLTKLAEIFDPKKTTPATVDFVDIAGLAKGASQGEGLGNQFLGHIRQVDAIVHVVRCFTHAEAPDELPNPADDVETLEIELILADHQSVAKQKEKADREAKKGTAGAKARYEMLSELLAHLADFKPARTLAGGAERHDMFLLTDKPVLYAANVAEDYAAGGSPDAAKLREALGAGAHVLEISAGIESELADLPADEAAEFMASLGMPEPGLNRLIRESYSLLGLMSFLTAGKDECRAWSIPVGTRAQDAAREIHSDIARGFIRAEIISYDDLVAAGSWSAAKEKGHARLEGRDYIMLDGDVVNFRFQV
ncbi:MAG TPA: redox-regulated ATPase YchF [Armatimonadota bacterium]|jgi:hypothetical protein